MAEPTFLEAIARVRKELAGAGILVAALGGGGGWLGLGEVDKQEKAAAALATHYVPALAQCEVRFQDQRKICLELIESERENTAQWRAQCGGP